MHDSRRTEGTRRARVVSTWCLAAFIGISIGCRLADSSHEGLKPTYDRASGRLRELSYDSDEDGRFDMNAVMDGNRVLKVEVDENQDGRPDRWEYYDSVDRSPGAPAVNQTPVRIERATRHDGRVTRTEGFHNGTLAWVEEDRDGDGKVDRWETYVDGALSTLALDTRGRGTPDRRITYEDKWKSEKLD
jgi:hypothetical protein